MGQVRRLMFQGSAPNREGHRAQGLIEKHRLIHTSGLQTASYEGVWQLLSTWRHGDSNCPECSLGADIFPVHWR